MGQKEECEDEGSGRKKRFKRKRTLAQVSSPTLASDLNFTHFVHGLNGLNSGRRLNILQRIVRATRENKGDLALKLTLLYLDNPRLVVSDELDPHTLSRLIEEYVFPLVDKTPQELENIRQRIRVCLDSN